MIINRYKNRGAHGDSSLLLTTLVVLSEKLPLLSDSESGESMSLIDFITYVGKK